MTQTISVLPESDEQALCVRYTGKVTATDFDKYHHQELVHRAKARNAFNMVVLYDADFTGWEPDAAAANLKSICVLGKCARKLAYVNPKKKKVFLMKVMAGLLENAEIRYFEAGAYAEAVAWVKSGSV